MIYTRPSATAAVEDPGKSAVHSGCAASILSGNPVSRETPSCSGPRQFSQPETAASLAVEKKKSEVTKAPTVRNESIITVQFPTAQGAKPAPAPQTLSSARNMIHPGKDCNRIIPIRIIFHL